MEYNYVIMYIITSLFIYIQSFKESLMKNKKVEKQQPLLQVGKSIWDMLPTDNVAPAKPTVQVPESQPKKDVPLIRLCRHLILTGNLFFRSKTSPSKRKASPKKNKRQMRIQNS